MVVTKEVVQIVVATLTPKPTAKPEFKPLPLPVAVIEGKFDVGGHNLYIECYGEGNPTVILEHGLGTGVNTWYRIIPHIAAETRVCAYDRMNSGNSDVIIAPRTMNQAADELHTLLRAAKIGGPYVLAGHSLGGPFVLVYADRYSEDIAGIALIDSTHPDQEARWLAALPMPSPNETEALKSARYDLMHPLPQAEGIDWKGMLERVRAVKSVGGIPLVVLVSYDPEKSGWPGLPPEVAANLNKVWLDVHQEYTGLSTNGSLVIASKSGHFIQNDEPQLVIDAILGLVDKARQK
jgi:pimeloyl-ACP methyl ester carboxylesterase